MYEEPEWSRPSRFRYSFQVIKQGVRIGDFQLPCKAVTLVGALDSSDLRLDHPSISRKQAVLQTSEKQLFLFDLGSLNGTFVNRTLLPSRVYSKLRPFDQVKFGFSSRTYLVRCKVLEEQEEESSFLKLLKETKASLPQDQYKQVYLKLLGMQTTGRRPSGRQDMEGISWGIIDEEQIYQHQRLHNFQLRPDVLRQLPGLSQQQLRRIDRLQKMQGKVERAVGEGKKDMELNENLLRVQKELMVDLFGEKAQEFRSNSSEQEPEVEVERKQGGQVFQVDDYRQVQRKCIFLEDQKLTILRKLEAAELQSQRMCQEEGDSLDKFMTDNQNQMKRQLQAALRARLIQLQSQISGLKLGLECAAPGAIIESLPQDKKEKREVERDRIAESLQLIATRRAEKQKQENISPEEILRREKARLKAERKHREWVPQLVHGASEEPQKRKEVKYGPRARPDLRDRGEAEQEQHFDDVSKR